MRYLRSCCDEEENINEEKINKKEVDGSWEKNESKK